MANPPFLPPPRADLGNGVKNGSHQAIPSLPPEKRPGFVAPFFGAFAAVVILALVGGGIYFLSTRPSTQGNGASAKDAKGPLENVAQWQEGPVMDGTLADPVKPDISWWTRTFDLPNLSAEASEFLKKEGLVVNSIEPIHYTDNKDTTVLTYQVSVSVPGQLLRVPKATWQATSPTEARFTSMLVLNEGLPPGTYWDTHNAQVEADANAPRSTLFNVRLNKATDTVTADRLIPTDLVTPDEVTDYQRETQRVIATLEQRLQQIDAQVAQDTQSRLAQVPPDPPKPTPQVAHFGGDGSGEPTKSAERIGGGAAAGAAGGALFGAAAGNAGMGAGIGAGVGLLSGIIYNAVSKSNDKEKLERQVADENEEALDEWHSQIKALKQQRAQIRADVPQERQAALDGLASQIASNQGHLDRNWAPAPNPSAPTSEQPTGPTQQP